MIVTILIAHSMDEAIVKMKINKRVCKCNGKYAPCLKRLVKIFGREIFVVYDFNEVD